MVLVVMNDIDVQLGGDDVISSGETIDVLVSLEKCWKWNASNITVSLVDVNDDPFISLLNDGEIVNSLGSNSSTEVELSFMITNSALLVIRLHWMLSLNLEMRPQAHLLIYQ